jgi:hypothetical protein
VNNRIAAIDAIRGLCLINIYINHNSLGFLAKLSPSRLTFCDSADIFIFLAGLSSYLAYVGKSPFAISRATRALVRAVWLYAANLLVILGSFALIFLGTCLIVPADVSALPHTLMVRDGVQRFLWNVVTMQQSVGYSTVLRLHIYQLIMAPLWLWLAARCFWHPIIPAALVWAISGHFGWVARDALTNTQIQLTILPWTLIYVLGISVGAAIQKGIVFERSRLIDWFAISYLVLIPAIVTVGLAINPEIGAWVATRNDHFWIGASKYLQSPMRVLSLMSLAYLFITHRDAPVFRLVHFIDANHPLCRLGRRSLDVFAVGALLAIFNEWSLWGMLSISSPLPRMLLSILWEALCVTVGIVVMMRVADRRRGIFAGRLNSFMRRGQTSASVSC